MYSVSSLTCSDGDDCPRSDDGDDVWPLRDHLKTGNGHAHGELGMEDRRLEYGLFLLQPSHEDSHENVFSIVPSSWIQYLINILHNKYVLKLFELKFNSLGTV